MSTRQDAGSETTTLKTGGSARRARQTSPQPRANLLHAAVFESAKEAGLLQGERTRHVSFRAPPALVEAAMRETGVTSASELGILALAALAQSDPVSAFMRQNRGRLGRDHKLDY